MSYTKAKRISVLYNIVLYFLFSTKNYTSHESYEMFYDLGKYIYKTCTKTWNDK